MIGIACLVQPLPLAGEVDALGSAIARQSAAGGGSLHNMTRGDTRTPTLPRKRERERASVVILIGPKVILLIPVSDARIDRGIQHVDGEVGEHDHHRDQHHEILHDRVVAPA